MLSLHFSKSQSGFWEISRHFEEWMIRTLLIREIRLIGAECDVRVCSLMKVAVQSGHTQHSPRMVQGTRVVFLRVCTENCITSGISGSLLTVSIPWMHPDFIASLVTRPSNRQLGQVLRRLVTVKHSQVCEFSGNISPVSSLHKNKGHGPGKAVLWSLEPEAHRQ